MSNLHPIYLEPDEEITSVIDKISAAEAKNVAVVVPKNSTLFQSLVNLKLLSKEAGRLDKKVSIISTDKIGQRLAKQVGIESYASLGTVAPQSAPEATSEPKTVTEPVKPADQPRTDVLPDGTKVNLYSPDTTLGAAGVTEAVAESMPTDELIPSTKISTDKPSEVAEPTKEVPPSATEPIEEKTDAPAKPEPNLTTVKLTPVEPREPSIPVEAALPPVVGRSMPHFNPRNYEFKIPWRSVVVSLALIIVALGVVYLLLPKAKVTITLPSKAVSQTLTLAAKITADDQSTTIAGSLLTSDQSVSKAITATGKKDIGTKAGGTIAVKNCEDSDTHSVAAGTKVTASSKTFLTNTAITVPAGIFSNGGSTCKSASVSVAITADQAGEAYNLSNATFAIAGQPSHITGQGSTTGGQTKQVTVLSQTDIDQAVTAAKKDLNDKALADLKTKADKQTLLDAATFEQIKEQKVDKEVGAQVDTATLSLTLSLSSIAFDAAAATDKWQTEISKQLATNEELVVPESKKPTFAFKDFNSDKTALNFDVLGSGFAVAKIDKTAVAQSINNQSVSRAEQTLRDNYGATDVAITLNPSWWPARLPLLHQAIAIEYGFKDN